MSTETLVIGIIAALALGAVIAAMTLIPTLSRLTVPLGVSVPADRVHDPVVRTALRRYRRTCLAAGGLVGVGLFATLDHPASMVAWSLGYLIVATSAFVAFRRPIIEAKRAGGWYAGHRVAVSAPVTPDALGGVRPTWSLHLVALFIALGAAGWTAASFDRLPDPLPAHWGAGGIVDRWEPKTWTSVLSMPAFSVLTVATVVALCVWMGRRTDPLLPDGNPQQARREQARKQHVMQVALGWINVATALLFAALGANLIVQWPADVFSGIMVAGVAAVTVPVIWMTIAGARISRFDATAEGPDSPDDDAHWPLGLVYYNREDPRLNVPKRAGLGYTINVAHPMGLALTALLVVTLIGSAVLPFALAR